jgi:hypothetical protein
MQLMLANFVVLREYNCNKISLDISPCFVIFPPCSHVFSFTEYGNYNSSGTAYGGYAGYSQPAPAAGAAGGATAATPNYPSTQGYDQIAYNQPGSWGQQQGYGSYGATGDQTYSQQGLYAFLLSHLKYFGYCLVYMGKLCMLFH